MNKSGIAWLWLAFSPAASYFRVHEDIWAGYGQNPQHTAISPVPAQPLNSIHWSTSVDLDAPTGDELMIHYGSISVTAANTVLVPVKTGAMDGFEVRAYHGATGAFMYALTTGYTVPSSAWIPPYGPTLSGGTRLYYPGAAGTVYYRDAVNSPKGPNGQSGATGQFVFYGKSVYQANRGTLHSDVRISTPITADRFGNIYFGFIATPGNAADVVGGLARINAGGEGAWVSAWTLSGHDPNITQVALNCAPALSNDQRTVYVVASGPDEFTSGYMVALSAETLAPLSRRPLMDPRGGPATISSDSSGSPMVGPDGDVYYGVLENNCCSSHNDRGWMLHFNASLRMEKEPGSFGWDNTASIVPAAAIPSYHGRSSYLILTKYNNYLGVGSGDGVNKMAVLDPHETQLDEYAGPPVTVMREVLTVTGVTSEATQDFPTAVSEWCVNTAAIDPFTKAALVNSEDGVLYRWDFSSNTLLQRITLGNRRGEAYTPTAIGPDGTVYAINDAILYAVGK